MNFKQFSTSDNQWHDVPYYQHKTATDTLTLPATLYPNDTSITVGIKGQSSQASTPTPSQPCDVVGVGELETSGEHAGQYKIPILLNNQTINKYLGTEQTVRQIKKLVFNGSTDENWVVYGSISNTYRLSISQTPSVGNPALCTHFVNSSISSITSGKFTVGETYIYIRYADVADLTEFKTYLAQQYSAGHPVTVYYVLATPQTAITNEPLMKIGTYADSLTTSIPCTAGENTLDVQTTVQPSEVAAGFSGWHPVTDVHEYDSNYTIATMQALTIAQLQTHTISDLQGGEWS
jgi:hypothetical protein